MKIKLHTFLNWELRENGKGYRIFPGVKRAGRGVALTTHLHLASRLRKE
jgi:hypothetical protein